jgi:hypothetical protein
MSGVFRIGRRGARTAERARRVAPASHSVRFYADGQFPAGAIAGQLHRALREPAAAIVIATTDHADAIADRLRRRGTSLGSEISAGRLLLRDADRAARSLVQEGGVSRTVFDELVRAPVLEAADRHGRVAAYGEIVDVLCRSGRPAAALALEQLWNELLADPRIELLCGYSIEPFATAGGETALRAICSEHGQIELRRSCP